MIAGYGLSPPLVPYELALTNRVIGTTTFWGLAWLIMHYQGFFQRQSAVTEQTKLELRERTQDIGRMVTALQAPRDQEHEGIEQPPVVIQGFKRHVTDMLVAEACHLNEKATDLARKDETTPVVDKGLDSTLEEHQHLRKQLERLQRDLLH